MSGIIAGVTNSDIVTTLEDSRRVCLYRYSSTSPDLFTETPIEQYNTLNYWPGYSMYTDPGDVQGFLTSCQITPPEYSRNYLELAGTSAPTDATRNPFYSTRELTFSVLIDLIPIPRDLTAIGYKSDIWTPSSLCERLLNASRNVFMKPYKWCIKVPSVNAFYFGRCTSVTAEVIGTARAIILTYTFTVEPWCYEPCSSYTWSKPSTEYYIPWTYGSDCLPWFGEDYTPKVQEYATLNTFLPAVKIESPSKDLQATLRFYQSSTKYEEVTGYVFAGETVEFTGTISAPYGFFYYLKLTESTNEAFSVNLQAFLKGF